MYWYKFLNKIVKLIIFMRFICKYKNRWSIIIKQTVYRYYKSADDDLTKTLNECLTYKGFTNYVFPKL